MSTPGSESNEKVTPLTTTLATSARPAIANARFHDQPADEVSGIWGTLARTRGPVNLLSETRDLRRPRRHVGDEEHLAAGADPRG